MTAQLLDGRAMAKAIRGEISADVAVFASQYGRAPAIAVVQVEGDPASAAYVRQIEKSCKGVGMGFRLHLLPAQCDALALVSLIKELNADPQMDGIIVQMPLPRHLPQS